MTRAKPPKVLSLFTGAGGLDLGLEAAGFEVAGCIEMDEDARRTLAINRPGWRQASPGDIHQHSPVGLLKSLALKPGEVSVVSGGPPCQPFSKSTFWVNGAARGLSDPRASTLTAYLGIVEAALPEAMILENVRGITHAPPQVDGSRGLSALDVLHRELDKINVRHGTEYVPHVFKLDAACYGVPQHRERLFVLAFRSGTIVTEPPRTHGDATCDPKLLRYATAWDALADVDEAHGDDPDLKLTGQWAGLLPSIPEGQNYLWHTSRGGGKPLFGWRTKYWSFLLKLAKSRPAWTLQASPGPATGPFHWRNRRLSVEEMARLQTFPDDARQIHGSYFSARRQVGNAVPSALGELLGLVVQSAVNGRGGSRQLSLIPPLRDEKTRRHPVQPVPDRYLSRLGDHPDHPGAGRGPGAASRSGSQG